MLAKQNWDAEVLMQIGLSQHPADKILSITSYTTKGNNLVTLNAFDIKNKKVKRRADMKKLYERITK